MTQSARSADTRRRLIEAGLEVFAEEGFRNATLQEICGRAGANIAAANYHFGGKEELYAAVFEYAVQRATTDGRSDAHAADASPEERLRAHIGTFLGRLLDPGRQAWIARLVAREMIEPTPVLDRLVRKRMRANHELIAGAIRDLLGPGASDETVRFCTLSVVAQCVFYRNSAPVITRLYPDLQPAKEVRRIAEHVTSFSLGAIRGLKPSERRKRA